MTAAILTSVHKLPDKTETLKNFFDMKIRHVLLHFLMEEAFAYAGSKSDLFTCFQGISHSQSRTPAPTSVVIDGAVIVQILKPDEAKNFDEYAQDIFIPYMSSQLQTASRLDLV